MFSCLLRLLHHIACRMTRAGQPALLSLLHPPSTARPSPSKVRSHLSLVFTSFPQDSLDALKQ
ncbi:hypothetical protein E2C01_055071 [Portunus trituberculatus]|uniref:Uncharacterized protein n=1 Tax=Portunus trituberculatus TaxID=210409 RepID=A0A5B7GTU8_PORTR|nr:hypothetical protein [Portunus trituberculatus]